jgi:hypothetical protein
MEHASVRITGAFVNITQRFRTIFTRISENRRRCDFHRSEVGTEELGNLYQLILASRILEQRHVNAAFGL